MILHTPIYTKYPYFQQCFCNMTLYSVYNSRVLDHFIPISYFHLTPKRIFSANEHSIKKFYSSDINNMTGNDYESMQLPSTTATANDIICHNIIVNQPLHWNHKVVFKLSIKPHIISLVFCSEKMMRKQGPGPWGDTVSFICIHAYLYLYMYM